MFVYFVLFAGQKTLENFDDVFYGLLDEAAQLVTQDQKGAFKEMVLRHRSDLTKNVNENLLKKDKITLQDVSNMFARELKNRAELFNYLGSGIWNKISTTSKSLFNRYRLYCSENPSNMLCLSDKDDKTKSNEIEHEDLP